jgi:hypothetical protein
MRYRKILFELLKTLNERRFKPSINKIKYHIGDKLSINELKRICFDKLMKAIPIKMQIQFVVRNSNELHDRFILTDIGGVMYGHGLDESLGHNLDVVNVLRLSHDHYKTEWREAEKKEVTFVIGDNN